MTTEINNEHINMIAEGMRRMMTKPDYYRFTNKIQPKLIVYGTGSEWHVATHDGTAVSRIWSTHTSKDAAVMEYNRMMAVNQLRDLLANAPGKIQLRFDVEMADRVPMWRPIAWRPVSADRWQRFDNAPWFPQSDVYAAVRVTGGQMERECHGAGRELVYWYQKAA